MRAGGGGEGGRTPMHPPEWKDLQFIPRKPRDEDGDVKCGPDGLLRGPGWRWWWLRCSGITTRASMSGYSCDDDVSVRRRLSNTPEAACNSRSPRVLMKNKGMRGSEVALLIILSVYTTTARQYRVVHLPAEEVALLIILSVYTTTTRQEQH